MYTTTETPGFNATMATTIMADLSTVTDPDSSFSLSVFWVVVMTIVILCGLGSVLSTFYLIHKHINTNTTNTNNNNTTRSSYRKLAEIVSRIPNGAKGLIVWKPVSINAGSSPKIGQFNRLLDGTSMDSPVYSSLTVPLPKEVV